MLIWLRFIDVTSISIKKKMFKNDQIRRKLNNYKRFPVPYRRILIYQNYKDIYRHCNEKMSCVQKYPITTRVCKKGVF